ncbi:hypothetical protein A4A49_25152 [Nicotiana attenuata]|uniref:Uncharacterized protein n=1 Tax=Nicotiana attenuata TaxID=49451 RepID=A0A314LBF0_NICAT|nr:hypothetical protein A4A49_25152 [Nicotiana attenuata]
MAKTKPSSSSSIPRRSHRFRKTQHADEPIKVELSEGSDHQVFEDESSDSPEETLITQKEPANIQSQIPIDPYIRKAKSKTWSLVPRTR